MYTSKFWLNLYRNIYEPGIYLHSLQIRKFHFPRLCVPNDKLKLPSYQGICFLQQPVGFSSMMNYPELLQGYLANKGFFSSDRTDFTKSFNNLTWRGNETSVFVNFPYMITQWLSCPSHPSPHLQLHFQPIGGEPVRLILSLENTLSGFETLCCYQKPLETD